MKYIVHRNDETNRFGRKQISFHGYGIETFRNDHYNCDYIDPTYGNYDLLFEAAIVRKNLRI